MFNPSKVTNKWFFSSPHKLLRPLEIYIKGDAIVLIKLWLIILMSLFFDWKFTIVLIGIYLFLRGLGEMFYWLLQQFGDRKYRPESKYNKLDNNGVYIIYQLEGLFNAFIGLGLIALRIIYL